MAWRRAFKVSRTSPSRAHATARDQYNSARFAPAEAYSTGSLARGLESAGQQVFGAEPFSAGGLCRGQPSLGPHRNARIRGDARILLDGMPGAPVGSQGVARGSMAQLHVAEDTGCGPAHGVAVHVVGIGHPFSNGQVVATLARGLERFSLPGSLLQNAGSATAPVIPLPGSTATAPVFAFSG